MENFREGYMFRIFISLAAFILICEGACLAGAEKNISLPDCVDLGCLMRFEGQIASLGYIQPAGAELASMQDPAFGGAAPAPPKPVVIKKVHWTTWIVAPLLSILVPGTGHFYIGTKTAVSEGAYFMLADAVCFGALALGVVLYPYNHNSDTLTGIATAAVLWVIDRVLCVVLTFMLCMDPETSRLERMNPGPSMPVSLGCHYEPSGNGHEFGTSVSVKFG
jgi:hypothetical protein